MWKEVKKYMNHETRTIQEFVIQLADTDAKRPIDWVRSRVEELFEAYEHLPQKNSIAAYAQTIEPLVSWLSADERHRFGESLWQDRREWLTSHTIDEPYPLTGLADYLSPPVGGS